MERQYSRRSYAAILCSGTLILSGCASNGQSQSNDLTLCSLVVVNHHSDSHQVDIRIEEDSEEMFSASEPIDSGSDLDNVGTLSFADELPDSRGELVLFSRIDDDSWEEFTLNEFSNESIEVILKIDQEGRLGFFYTETCEKSSE